MQQSENCGIFRELSMLDTEPRKVYDCHPCCCLEIWIPLWNKIAWLYGRPQLKFWKAIGWMHGWSTLYLGLVQSIRTALWPIKIFSTLRWLTFCCARVSSFRSTFKAYTSPVYFSRTTRTSPKWPRPIIFFTSKSSLLILNFFRSSTVEASTKN